ncbi:VanW family protein [Candidatus Dojkabacteria bacterium]|uniref:VanW family protein n=1 Tax=Candidatus Dojkabacteria bacterium TaxID=2099670 RepID=A0A955LAZ4_9BACT|nr:VanW family protein [Candidatus Dojkabacteria bacterium]
MGIFKSFYFLFCSLLLILISLSFFVLTKVGVIEISNASTVTLAENITVIFEVDTAFAEVNPSNYLSQIGDYFVLDSVSLLFDLGINYSNSDYVSFDSSNRLINCKSNNYNVRLNEDDLSQKLIDSYSNETFSKINIEDYILGDTFELIKACKLYEQQFSEIYLTLENSIGLSRNIAEDVFGFYKNEDGYSWKIYNDLPLKNKLAEISERYNVEPFPGEIEEFDNFIAVYKLPSTGEKLSIDNTIEYISLWINNRKIKFAPIIESTSISEIQSNKPVYDFTNLVGTGQTRIDLIRDGQGNSAVYFAELGLEEIQKVVIMPGEEFSYLRQIAKQPGLNRTASGRLIGSGYCNSTTTIFRAALETGLPITDRSSHGQNIASYDWGYPINAVDSTFYAVEGMEIDLKFINDFDYPIMLYYEKSQDENDFQYHYVHIFTSSQASKRRVELFDWRKWDVYSPTQFKAEFKRKVWDGVNLLTEDGFYSRYYY